MGSSSRAFVAFATMSSAFLLLAMIFTTPSSATKERENKYGVGFHLALDHALASVYFANGTYADIARIQAGPHYRESMRRFWPDDSIPGYPSELTPAMQAVQPLQTKLHAKCYDPSWPVSLSRELYLDFYTSHNFSSQDSITCKLMPWTCRDESVEGLSRMLVALKAASESYLEDEVTTAELALPWYIPSVLWDPFRATSVAAGQKAGLSFHRFGQFSGEAAERLHNSDIPCYDDPSFVDELILTIDYSHAALSMNTFYRDCGFSEWRGGFHYSQLGAEALSKCRNINDETTCRDKLVAGVRQAILDPLSNPYPETQTFFYSPQTPEVFGKIVLVGESAHDPYLSEVLREVLRDVLPDKDYLDVILAAEQHNELLGTGSLFAAARGMAIFSWELEEWAVEGPILGCPI